MPELPEVEVLVRHLRPLIRNRTIRGVQVNRARVLAPTRISQFKRTLLDATFTGVERRGKYLCFTLRRRRRGKSRLLTLLGHLGMTGRMFLAPRHAQLPKHAAVVLELGRQNFVFEDTRYFGRLTLDDGALSRLGPEPLGAGFTPDSLRARLARSNQAIKVKLLDQSVVAGIGNIYASEALHRARIPPQLPARRLGGPQVRALCRAIHAVLHEAIRFGSTLPLNHGQAGERDGLFYFGRAPAAPDYYEERLRVYDREGKSCRRCGGPIRRMIQAARSTFYCPQCQRAPARCGTPRGATKHPQTRSKSN